jgi:hypothetical protein
VRILRRRAFGCRASSSTAPNAIVRPRLSGVQLDPAQRDRGRRDRGRASSSTGRPRLPVRAERRNWRSASNRGGEPADAGPEVTGGELVVASRAERRTWQSASGPVGEPTDAGSEVTRGELAVASRVERRAWRSAG